MIPRYRVLRERIEAELAEVSRAAEKSRQAYDAAEEDSQQAIFFLDSAAMNLHGFYSGIERIFEWIARELDGGLPTGSTWHRDLLMQMTLEVESVCPAVIRPETAHSPGAYLRFRRLVRNLYVREFEAAKLADLVAGISGVLADLHTDLARFARFLEAASLADEIETNWARLNEPSGSQLVQPFPATAWTHPARSPRGRRPTPRTRNRPQSAVAHLPASLSADFQFAPWV